MRIRPIKFPEDELPHNKIIEWWYFNGNLQDSKGNKYAFMNCFFKADVKKVKIHFLKGYPFKTICFSHSILSKIKAKKFDFNVDYVSLVSKDSFSKPLLFVNYINPVLIQGYVNKVIEETSEFNYHIKNENVDLNLTSIKKPLLEAGKGYVDLKSKGSYYYSLTNLKTQGTINVNGKSIKVKGKSWMDHQWANASYSKDDKWTWFSIQLDNNTELICIEYENGKSMTYMATISYPDNKQVTADDLILTPTNIKWKSTVTKAEYPLSWTIEIPSKNIVLKVEPLLKNQEVLFGTINYWEGPLKVKGTINKKKVNGVGFMELVGYPIGVSDFKLYRTEIRQLIKESMAFVKEKGAEFVEDFIKRRKA